MPDEEWESMQASKYVTAHDLPYLGQRQVFLWKRKGLQGNSEEAEEGRHRHLQGVRTGSATRLTLLHAAS